MVNGMSAEKPSERAAASISEKRQGFQDIKGTTLSVKRIKIDGYEQSKALLESALLVFPTPSNIFCQSNQNPEVKNGLKGNSFYVAGNGMDLSVTLNDGRVAKGEDLAKLRVNGLDCSFNQKGNFFEVTEGEVPIEKIVRILPGSCPMFVTIHSDRETSVTGYGSRFNLNAAFIPNHSPQIHGFGYDFVVVADQPTPDELAKLLIARAKNQLEPMLRQIAEISILMELIRTTANPELVAKLGSYIRPIEQLELKD
jgi:hypothetical protein